MEFIAELLLEALFHLLSLTVGVGLAFVTYALWVIVRRRVWGLDKVTTVRSPDDEVFRLEVPTLRLRIPVSRRLFNTRNRKQLADDEAPGWDEFDWLHPGRVVTRFEEWLIVVVPFMLAGVVLFVLLFIVEVIIAMAIAAVVALISAVRRSQWRCVVTDDDGRTWGARADRLRDIRRVRDELADAIRSGDLHALETPVA